MKQNFKRKLLAGLLSACMMLQIVGTVPVYAVGNAEDSGLPTGTSSVCTHVHDEKCGYTEGTPCTSDPATCESCKAKNTADNRATLAGEVYAVWDGSKFWRATQADPTTATSEEILSTDKKTINHLHATGTPLMAVCTNLKTVTCADTVTSIGNRAFDGCTALASASMPNVTTIGEKAFNGCTGLTSVEMPKVSTIGTYAFNGCTKLASIEMPEATQIDMQAFHGCTGLTGINLPKAITIDENAFNGCTNLERVELPEATTIGVSAFDGSLTKPVSISLPKVTSIGEFAFKDCTGLTSIDLPEATVVGGDGNSAFAGCTGLASANLPKVEVIVISAFRDCAKLTSINMPKATTIKNNAFNFCTSLASVTMPNVTTIGEYAFSGCEALTSINMPNVTTIGSIAFNDCKKLASLTLGATPPATVSADAFTRCPTPRTLIIQGNTANSEAVLAAYKAVADGDVNDDKWWGWTLPESMVTITEQFTLATGQTYYFDLSAEKSNIGTINPAVPDTTLHYVPFTYAGTVNAYSLTSAMATTDEYANANKSDRSLFVADYNVSYSKPWNDLNAASLIFGKTFDTNYKLRSLSAGSSKIETPLGGTPTANEWDSILGKSGLTNPIKNWSNIYSWGQDTRSSKPESRAVRGSTAAAHWGSKIATASYKNFGWRPALEVLNPAGLTADGLKAVTLNLNGGKLKDSTANINIVCAGTTFKAPSGEGLTPPSDKVFDKWQKTGDTNTTYAAGDTITHASGLGLTAQWRKTPQAISYANANISKTYGDAKFT
ncbi:MAG: leucine-rich repeat domain-containing protein, partial [Clostridia bacterium]